jgi:hypothetical protein
MLVVGVDGGATKTSAVVIKISDGTRLVVGRSVSGSSNRNSVGNEAAVAAMHEVISAALKVSNGSDMSQALLLNISMVPRRLEIMWRMFSMLSSRSLVVTLMPTYNIGNRYMMQVTVSSISSTLKMYAGRVENHAKGRRHSGE